MKVLLDMESKPQAKECSLLNWTLITSPWIVLIDILLKKLFNHSFYSSHNFDFTVSLPIKYSIKQNWTNYLFHEISLPRAVHNLREERQHRTALRIMT